MKIPFDTFEIKSFDSEESCLKLIADQKWTEGYTCRKCGNRNFCKGKTLYSRRCTRCKYEESATAHTIFHRCHIPLKEAFRIFSLVCNNPGVSTYEISRNLNLRQMTCWKLKNKMMECMEKKGKIDLLFETTKQKGSADN